MRHLQRIGTVTICLAAVLLSPAVTRALSLEEHKQITLESLEAVVRPSPPGSPPGTQLVYRFTPASAEQVANASRDMDVETRGSWLIDAPPDEHAEAGTWARSQRRVDLLRAEIRNALVLADSSHELFLGMMADRSRLLLGEALHTLQDLRAQATPDEPGGRSAALKASVQFVQTLVSELESAGAGRSICFLLGRDDCGEPDESP